MSNQRQSLFDDIDSTVGQTQSKAAAEPGQRMFISGDLSSFHLPEEALRERRRIPPFWKGFIFPIACGMFVLVLMVLISMSYEDQEVKTSETMLVSNGIQTEFSHVSQLPLESDQCYDINLNLRNTQSYMHIDCWPNLDQPLKPISIERNAEVAVLNDGDTSAMFTLPITPAVGAEITFSTWNGYSSIQTFTHYNGDGQNKSFSVDLPSDVETEEIRAEVEISGNGEYSENYWFQRESDCYYSGSRCTLYVYYDSQEGFWDSTTNLFVLNLTKPLENGATLELVYLDYDDGPDDLIFLFFWLPPLIYTIGVIAMFVKKANQMGVGALVGLIPTFPGTLIFAAILGEMLF